jgi:uncharacterized membrane protein
MSLFDQDKVDALTETVVTTLKTIGITVPEETVTYSLQDGHLVVMLMGMVNDDAADQPQESKQLKQGLNQMLAEQHRLEMDEKLKGIQEITADEASLEAALFGDTCEHPNIHPEGFCIDCGETPDNE